MALGRLRVDFDVEVFQALADHMKKSLCWVTTSPLIVNFFLVPHLLRLSARYSVTLVVNTNGEVALKPLPGVEIVSIAIPRNISPVGDMTALIKLTCLFHRRTFDLLHSFGPKAGLLAMLAGWIERIPLRIHTFTGQVWVTRKGPMRRLLKTADKLIGWLATIVLADSPSQKGFLEREGVLSPGACIVLGSGSVCGVNTRRFKADPEARASVRRKLGIPEEAVLILFLGRLNKDKGIPELLHAFGLVGDSRPDVHLALVGPDEENCLSHLQRIGDSASRISYSGYTPVPEHYIAASDILCLPSHREGFGSVIIEAASAGIPAVAARVYGITDAVVDGKTGLLHTPGDAHDLAEKIDRLAAEPGLRAVLGANAQLRAIAEFDEDILTGELLRLYQERL